MNKFFALLLAMATIFGLGACTPASQAQAPVTAQQQQVAPVSEPVNPPTVVNAPVIELANVEVKVTTTPAPVEPEPLPVYAPEPVAYSAPVQYSTPVYSVPVQPYSAPVQPYVPTCEEQGLITVEDGSCVPASYFAPEPVAACYEDMPCWDCSTMGNRICGTTEAVLLFAAEAKDPFTVTELTTMFNDSYLAMHPVGTATYDFETIGLNSEINPAYEYIFKAEGNYVLGQG